jgi:1-acyl-sn-glycerol-3-phosphate acyltransferase
MVCCETIISYALLILVILIPILWKVSGKCRYVMYMGSLYFAILMTTFISFFAVIWRPFDPRNHMSVYLFFFNICVSLLAQFLFIFVCRWVFRICEALTRWTNISFEVRNKHLLTNIKGPCVIVANHQSSIDVMGLLLMFDSLFSTCTGFLHIFPERGACMAKKSLQYAGFFGISAKLCGTVFIDRFNPNVARGTMDRMSKEVIDNNVCFVVILPCHLFVHLAARTVCIR